MSYVVKIAEDMFFSSIHLIRSQISVILSVSNKGYKVGIFVVHLWIFFEIIITCFDDVICDLVHNVETILHLC